jgi:regulator of cell morphogenesis and NO signaling
MTITESTLIAEIAAALPSSVRVFQRHGIDFCCGGKKPIGDVCRERGLQFESIAGEVQTEAARPVTSDRQWSREALGALIGHILATYHEPLREELPRLQAMAAKVAAVHGSKDPRLGRVSDLVKDLSADLHAHMQKEEWVLFPAIEALEAGIAPPLRIDASGLLSPSIVVVSAPGLLTAGTIALRPPLPARLRRVGWTLVAVSVLTAALAVSFT